MINILVRGCPGTGKTYLSRAAAYYICEQNLDIKDAFEQDCISSQAEIEAFVNSDRCEYIQVHPSMEFDDIVYGFDIKANGSMSIAYAEKRIMQLCNNAKGKNRLYCIILDDINRANAGRLLGNILYAMEYRNQEIQLADGSEMTIPDNVVLIFTENTLDPSNGLDLAIRRRMTFLKVLMSDRTVIRKWYRGFLSPSALKLILDVYDRIEDFIRSYISPEQNIKPDSYLPGHGFFIVDNLGTQHYVLDCFKQKLCLQIAPYLKELFCRGVLSINPESFIERLLISVNAGISGVCPIASIRKQLVRTGKDVTAFSLQDSRDYYKNTIVPSRCVDFRGMMECIIDAMILNGIFPYDVLMSSLLQNTSIAYIESLHTPIERAAYIIEKSKAPRFMYETVRGGKISGTHAYYSLDGAVTGRWESESDTEEYIVSYNDGRTDAEFIPLSGFRNHGFNPDSPELGVQHNTVNIMTAIHILLTKYYDLYKQNLALIMGSDPEYASLYGLISLEEQYLDGIKKLLKGRSPTGPKGDDNRLAFYGAKIANLSLLWYGVGEYIEVDKQKFQDLVSENG